MRQMPFVKIISANTDSEAVCASAAKISTTPGNAQEIFSRTRESAGNGALIRKVLRSGHRSVIEHAVFTLAFWNVSAFVEQYLIECRLASFTVKSRRYVDFSNQGYHIPEALTGQALERYCAYMDLLFGGYQSLLELGVPKEDARFLLPYAFCSSFYCTLNARELVSLISSIRYGRGAQSTELLELAQQLIAQLAEYFPVLLTEFEQPPLSPAAPTPWRCPADTPSLLPDAQIGVVRLLQAPAAPLELLRMAAAVANPAADGPEPEPSKLVASVRPRELEQLSYTFSISAMTLSGITHLVRHRMQSVIVPPIQSVDHSRCILPQTIRQNPQAHACYLRTLEKAGQMLACLREDEALRAYGVYFALSGNVMDVMSTMNARELMHFLRLRTCNRAQWEIQRVAIQMLELLRESCPPLFSHYGPSCVLTGHCPEGSMTCGRQSEMKERFQRKF